MLNTVRLLADAGCKIIVLCSSKGPFTEKLDYHKIPYIVTYIPEYRKLFERLLFRRHINRIASRLPEKGFDWIISNEMWWAPAAAALGKKTGSRSATFLRIFKTPEKLKKYDLENLDKVLCINPVMTEQVNNLQRGAGNAYDMFNPVSLPETDPESMEYWKEIINSWPDVRKTFLMVGSLFPLKNQTDAIKTLDLLQNHFKNRAGIVLAGNGDKSYIRQIKETARKLGLTDKILLPGYVEGVHEMLESVDYFLFPSLSEGGPRSVIEALLAGIPTFSYPLPGLEKIYGDYYPLFVSKKPKPKSLSSTVINALDDGNLDSYVSALQERVKTRFSEEKHLERLASMLEWR